MTQYTAQMEHDIAQIEAALNGCTLAIDQLGIIDLRTRQAMDRTDLVAGVLTPVHIHTNMVRVALANSIAQLRKLLELTAVDVAKHYTDSDAGDVLASFIDTEPR